MSFIAAKRIAVVAAMSAQQTPAAERAVAHALKDVLTKVEAAVQRARRTKPVSYIFPSVDCVHTVCHKMGFDQVSPSQQWTQQQRVAAARSLCSARRREGKLSAAHGRSCSASGCACGLFGPTPAGTGGGEVVLYNVAAAELRCWGHAPASSSNKGRWKNFLAKCA